MNTRKRQRVHAICQRPENREGLGTSQRYSLDTLPPEVLETVLRLLPFQEVASAVRLVSRHCSAVAATVLNNAFLAAGRRLRHVTRSIEKRGTTVKSDKEILATMRARNAIELIQTQYNMLTAVTWRYTHPPTRQKFSRLCFYAGSLLDDLNELLRRASNRPESFVGPYAMDAGVTYFVALCRRFMYFFEKVSERRVNRSPLVSGCKVVDILDCLVHGRQVVSFSAPTGTVKMKLKYVMQQAWFTCLEVPKTANECSWKDEQRFMYLRLRRLVVSVNEHFLECLHYKQESSFMEALSIAASRPLPSTYSGYGEYGGRFFCYGSMNENAYRSKFKVTSGHAPVNTGAETGEDVQRPSPSFDLVVEVELQCSPELAPLTVRNSLPADQLESRGDVNQDELFLRLDITCPASTANRLPGYFAWQLSSPRRLRSNS